jgi:hypothetical protein
VWISKSLRNRYYFNVFFNCQVLLSEVGRVRRRLRPAIVAEVFDLSASSASQTQ